MQVGTSAARLRSSARLAVSEVSEPSLNGATTTASGKSEETVPALDTLPGSSKIVTPTPSSTVTPNASGCTTPERHSKGTTSRARRKHEELRRQELRTSNLILLSTGLPVAAILLYNYLYPSSLTSHLSIAHTRLPTYHFSSIPAKCLFLSYREPESAHAPHYSTGLKSTLSATYLKGIDDLYLVVFWAVVWTLLREVLIRFFWIPFARLTGLSRRSTILRFAEQGWDVSSWGLSLSCGLWIMQHSPYKNLNVVGLWEGYPHYVMGGQLKTYYLLECGFWLHKVVALHVEKRRKDHWQMFSHHVITVALLELSYHYNFTRVGNVILILMDPCDIVLATAKMLKYLHYERLCNVAFGFFVFTWVVTRQLLYPRVLYSVIYELPIYIPYAWDPPRDLYLSEKTHNVFITLLSGLQVLLFIWLAMIIRVVVGVLRGKDAEDSRSDDEGEETDSTTASKSSKK